MYSTCLFCHHGLGRNDVIESFQVGRRLAFDPARGRLWVVCRTCRNWNLTPLEQRWEAVEECERTYRDTLVRVSTDHIGLATVREGTDLVRIGEPLRPEFAAWRYGDRIRHRRFRRLRTVMHHGAGEGAAMVVGAAASLASMSWIVGGRRRAQRVVDRLERVEARLGYDRELARVRVPGAEMQSLRFSHVSRLEIVSRDDLDAWTLRVAHADGIVDVDGPQAVQVAGQILSHLNVHAGSTRQLQDATRRITDAGDADRFIRASGRLREFRRAKRSIFWNDDIGVLGLTPTERIALEIAVHEDAERLAMQGELQALEDAWRDAEEIAAIADAMFEVSGSSAQVAPRRH